MNFGRPAPLALTVLLLWTGTPACAQTLTPAPRDLASTPPPGDDRDTAYQERLRASFAASQGLLGPLDGSWRLALDHGGDVYAFELVDRDGEVEGAWRDLRRTGLTASGFIDAIQRAGAGVTLRFDTSGGPAVVTLAPGADGRWTGELVEGSGRSPAVMRRN